MHVCFSVSTGNDESQSEWGPPTPPRLPNRTVLICFGPLPLLKLFQQELSMGFWLNAMWKKLPYNKWLPRCLGSLHRREERTAGMPPPSPGSFPKPWWSATLSGLQIQNLWQPPRLWFHESAAAGVFLNLCLVCGNTWLGILKYFRATVIEQLKVIPHGWWSAHWAERPGLFLRL